MSKPPSRSDKLIAAMHHAALQALAQAPGGQLKKSALLQAMESSVPLDAWAAERYETGQLRWRAIFGFASVGLVKGGYVSKLSGLWSITDEGRLVAEQPFDGPTFLAEVHRRYQVWKSQQIATVMGQTPSRVAVSAGIGALDVDTETEALEIEVPEVGMARILRTAHEALAAELIESIKACEPVFFERLVLQLLLNMGYGGSREDAGRTVGQSGDGGVDGIINEDPLGLDTIYLQAKRWQDAVGEGPVRDFIGALDIKGVKKGVFLTTSYFTPAARLAVQSIKSDKKIVLIDGARLADLMIAHDLGVSVAATYQLKRMDTDYFAED
jgi:restriction system protein